MSWRIVLVIRLQQAFKGGGDGGHNVQGDVVLVDSLQIGPSTVTIVGRSGAFATRAHGIEAMRIERQDHFESEVTDPVIEEVVDVG